jgi:hypothetical protein
MPTQPRYAELHSDRFDCPSRQFVLIERGAFPRSKHQVVWSRELSPCPKTYKSLDYTPAERHGTPPGLGLYRSELAPVKVFPDDKRVRLQDLTSEQRGLTGEVQKYIPPRIKAQSVGFFALHLRHPDSLRRIVSVISTLQLGAAMF